MSHWASLVDPRSAIPASLVPTLHAVMEHDEKPAAPIRTRTSKAREVRFAKSFRCRLLLLLKDGALDRRDFLELARKLAVEFNITTQDGISQASKFLINEGFMACEMKITARGLGKLGLKGSRA